MNDDFSATQHRDANTSNGDANRDPKLEESTLNSGDAVATPNQVSDANQNTRVAVPESKVQNGTPIEGDVLAPLNEDRDASINSNQEKNVEPKPDAETQDRAATKVGDPYVDLSKYSLTIGQALDLFAHEKRLTPSERTMQNYCKDGKIDCYKLQTTRDGRPIAEWLINERSLRAFIETRPTVGDASSHDRDATVSDAPQEKPLSQPETSPSQSTTVETEATAAQDSQMNAGTSEKRTVASMLIENAKLTAQLAGKDELIEEIKTDKTFLREEVVEARKIRGDVKELAERLLITHERVALGGVLAESASPTKEKPLHVEVDEPHNGEPTNT